MCTDIWRNLERMKVVMTSGTLLITEFFQVMELMSTPLRPEQVRMSNNRTVLLSIIMLNEELYDTLKFFIRDEILKSCIGCQVTRICIDE